jgi:hypothetical protein
MMNSIVFSSLNIDKGIQLAATYNMIHGHGILLSAASLSNGLETSYIPFQGWPPGFTFCLLPLSIVFSDLILVNQIVDCIFIFLFFIACQKLIWRIFYENRKEIFAVFCLLNSFNFVPFHSYTSTDLYAITMMLFAFCFIWDRFANRSSGLKSALLISLFMFFPAFIRFAYAPLAFVVPAAMMIAGKIRSERKLLSDGLLSFIFSTVLITGLFIFQRLYYGGTYLDKAAFSIYPGHLLHFDPFIFHAFFFTAPIESALGEESWKWIALRVMELILTLFITISFVNQLVSDKRENKFFGGFAFVLLATLLTVAVMLMFLSVISTMQSFTLNTAWTYVKEPRYFAPLIVFIQIYFCAALFTEQKKWLALSFRYFAIISFGYSFLYFSFKNYKVFIKHNLEGTTAFDSRNVFALYRIVASMDKSVKPVLIASPVPIIATLPILAGGIPVENYDSLLSADLSNVRNKTILAECNRPLTESQKQFIIRNNALPFISIGDNDWYKIDLK